jgi:hypothetical protein
LRVFEGDAEALPVSQQLAELVDLTSGDQDDVGHARGRKGPDRVEDHRLVEDVQQVLVHHARDGVEPSPEASGEHYSLHDDSST